MSPAARQLGSAGGKARAAKLSPEQRRAIARQAAEARWEAERRATWNRLPRVRIALADYLALPSANPLSGARWRTADKSGRLLIIAPDIEWPALGLKLVPVLRVPAAILWPAGEAGPQ